jgi:hypothetical protein
MVFDNGYIVEFGDREMGLFKEFSLLSPRSFVDYSIKEGDTIFSLAHHFYGVTESWYFIPEFNPELDIFNLIPGETITIPL